MALYLTDLEHKYTREHYVPLLPYYLRLTFSAKLVLCLEVEFDVDILEEEIRDALQHLVRRHRIELYGVDIEGGVEGSRTVWEVTLRIDRRGYTIGDARAMAEQIVAVLSVLNGKPEPSQDAVWDVVKAGRTDVLLGRSESAIIEAKSQDYDLSGDAGRIEIGQDIARFANAERGGMLFIGFRTRRVGRNEIIDRIVPIRDPRASAQRHRAAIDQRVFPPIEGLEVVELKESTSGKIIAIRVPPQPEELKPFIVHGAIVGGKVEGAFISIVRRRDEGSIPVSGPAIHAWLSAGRALMRSGKLPREE